MEYVHGVKITNIEAIKKLGLSMSEVAQTMIEIFARQIFCYGFVHCDPHRITLVLLLSTNLQYSWKSSCPKGCER